MERFGDLRRTHKKAWYAAWSLVLVAVVGLAQWRFDISDPIRTQVLGASVKSTPAPTITSGPSGTVPSTSATFTYSDSEKGVTFQCALDDASLQACPAGSVTYSGLTEGPHTFRVVAVGVTTSLATSRNWTVDSVVPTAPAISSGPENPTVDTSANFVFSGEAGARFECQLDAGNLEACSTPFTYKKVPVGERSFRVVAIDPAGNRSVPSQTYAWTVLINKAFGISGDAADPLYPRDILPGTPGTPLNLKISNPYNFEIEVVSIDVIAASSGGCSNTNLEVRSLAATHPTAIVVPANSSRLLSELLGGSDWRDRWPADWPTITMKNSTSNQDACKGKTFTLSYTGTATKP